MYGILHRHRNTICAPIIETHRSKEFEKLEMFFRTAEMSLIFSADPSKRFR